MAKTIVERQPVTDALIEQWHRIVDIVSGLDDEQWAEPSVLPGWSNGDIVAHIIGTESLLDGRAAPEVEGAAARAHVHNPIGALNESWIELYRPRTRSEVTDALREVVGVRTEALRGMSAAEFDAETATPAGPDTYGRFMRIRVFDCWMHEIDLHDSLGVPATDVRVAPAPTRTALDEIVASMPFVVGKRAGAPSGAKVAFELTGEGARTIRVEVADRAAAVDAFSEGGTADTTLRVDTVHFARLVGGRASADAGAVHIDGDRALGESVVAALNYVI